MITMNKNNDKHEMSDRVHDHECEVTVLSKESPCQVSGDKLLSKGLQTRVVHKTMNVRKVSHQRTSTLLCLTLICML
jgi:hypothetical protein